MTSMPPPWDPDDAETEETRILPRGGDTAETRPLPRTPPPVPPPRERRVVDDQGPPTPPDGRRRELWPWLLLALGLLAALLAALWWFSQDDDEPSTATKPVPSVVRLTVEDARDVLTGQGFVVASIRQASDEAPKDIVFRQDPEAGTQLQEGGTVRIWVSVGPASATVPDVVGRPVGEATSALEQAGLKAQVATVPSNEAEGTVVAQSPKAGTEVERDSSVRLNVSGGPGAVTVPNVTGSKVDAAVAALEDAGLRAETGEVDSEEPAGTVVGQEPAAGTEVQRGSSVRLEVSRGPQARPVPDVVGFAEQDAQTQLEAAGFRVRVVNEPAPDPSQVGLVLRQVPPAGREAPPNTLVTIVVGA